MSLGASAYGLCVALAGQMPSLLRRVRTDEYAVAERATHAAAGEA